MLLPHGSSPALSVLLGCSPGPVTFLLVSLMTAVWQSILSGVVCCSCWLYIVLECAAAIRAWLLSSALCLALLWDYLLLVVSLYTSVRVCCVTAMFG